MNKFIAGAVLVLCSFLASAKENLADFPKMTLMTIQDGYASDYVHNTFQSIEHPDARHTWPMVCVGYKGDLCYLVKKGEIVTLEYMGEKKVGSRFKHEKEMVFKVTAPEGTFYAILYDVE